MFVLNMMLILWYIIDWEQSQMEVGIRVILKLKPQANLESQMTDTEALGQM